LQFVSACGDAPKPVVGMKFDSLHESTVEEYNEISNGTTSTLLKNSTSRMHMKSVFRSKGRSKRIKRAKELPKPRKGKNAYP
jgi:hypothetical protein